MWLNLDDKKFNFSEVKLIEIDKRGGVLLYFSESFSLHLPDITMEKMEKIMVDHDRMRYGLDGGEE